MREKLGQIDLFVNATQAQAPPPPNFLFGNRRRKEESLEAEI